MSIKAIFSDMDDTLLVDISTTTQTNLEAIERAIESGIKFVPTTGRALGDIPQQIFDIKGLEYLILSTGASVYDVKNKQFIYNQYMDKELIIDILKKDYMQDVCYFAMINGKSCYQRSLFDLVKGTSFYDMLLTFAEFNATIVDNLFDEICKEDSHLQKVVLFFNNSEQMFNVINSTQELLEFDCASSYEHNLEITQKDTNKAQGIKFLCDRLGITTDEIATIGDSGNDIAMLEMCDNSYAVDNAMALVKKSAKHIAPANTDNGVAYVIEKCLSDYKN